MIDPITLEVIYHRLTSIADEMELTLLKSSFSTVVKEARDCSTAIFDAKGNTVAQAAAIPLHLGILMISVPQILEAFPTSEMQEGDVYIVNDPYSGGTHLPDITLIVPIIYQGEVVGLSTSMVHHQDMGAMTPGVPTKATSIYQEGLTLPPLKFYEAGKPVKVVHDIIRKNVRTPDIVIGDIRAQIAAGNVGRLRVLDLFGDYGKDVVLATLEELLDHAEVLTRQDLEKIPDGTYTFVDYMDNDGVELDKRIKFQVAVTVRGSDFIVDFTGTNPQVKGPFNCVPSSTWSAITYVIKAITDSSIPTNAGCFRPVTTILPEGSIVNPRFPGALGARAQAIQRIADAMLGALVKAIPERLTACSAGEGVVIYFGGTDPLTGKAYITNEIARGGLGARPTKDGIDVIATGVVNGLNVPAEAVEMNFPIRVLKAGLHDGSAGAGEYRGGFGLHKVLEILRGSVSVSYRGERKYTKPWGLFGGLPGASEVGFVVRKTGEKEDIPSKQDLVLNEGDQLHFLTPGGGGHGDPLKRRPEFVMRDVIDRKVSSKAAADDYGVVINGKSMTVNFEKTRELRKEKARVSGGVTWTYDRGTEGGRE